MADKHGPCVDDTHWGSETINYANNRWLKSVRSEEGCALGGVLVG